MARGGWIYVGSRMKSFVPPAEKLQIMRTCEAFIADTIKPRAIPKKVSTDRNYPIDVVGKWLANRYRIILRMKTTGANATVPEFDWPIARIGYVNKDLFDLDFYRHTGEWITLHQRITLAEALESIATEPFFQLY